MLDECESNRIESREDRFLGSCLLSLPNSGIRGIREWHQLNVNIH
jgi:hypothetical protein